MSDLEKKYFDFRVQEKMKFYGISYEKAVELVKRMKEQKILWKSAFNAWVDEVHPY